jgi:serine/threonine protein kinase
MLHDLRPGDPQLIGPYRLRGVLGTGGMGRVFLGASAAGGPTAVKVVHAELAADPEFRARFRQEIEVARRVSGPFTAPVIDADLDGPVLWLATAYVAGPSLADAVAERGPLPPGSVLALAAGLAAGLSAIHAAGVVHRDLTPSNVLLAQDGPRLIDFGLSGASGAAALAGAGLKLGSPGFMSPEQAEGRLVGPPSDVFSLGAVLAFAAAGEGPFGPGSAVAQIYRVIHRPPDLFHVPREVRGLIQRCLVKDPALRPTEHDLLAAVRATLSAPTRVPAPAARPFIRRPPVTSRPEAVTALTGTLTVSTGAPEAITAPMPVLAGLALVAPDLLTEGAAAEQVPGQSVPDSPRRPAPDRPRLGENGPSRRRHWQPLAAAAIIAGLLGAAVTADLTLAAAHSRPPAAQSERQAASIRRPSPATSPPLSPTDRRKPRTAVAHHKSSRVPASADPAPMAGSTPLADAARADWPVVSTARPSVTATPTRRPHPTASASPSPSPSTVTGSY